MKKLFKILGYILAAIVVVLILAILFFSIKWNRSTASNMALLGEEATVLQDGVFQYRDLNKNGKLDPYEDSRVDIDLRIDDILSQMNLEEKAGSMFITMIGMNKDGSPLESPNLYDPFSFFLEANSEMIAKKKMNHFNIMNSFSAEAMASWNNTVQKMAERTRLGIPITIATDPRHGATDNPGASIPTPFFSKWCSPLGLAAIGDTALVREFGDIARQEYTALGLRLALSPMADLATEPRWGRISGTFGEDAELSARMTKAYVLGFQGDSLSNTSVACMTKHFSGGGPQKDGEDAHFPYGADQVYPGDYFGYHITPFEEGAFAANTAQIMPYYGIPVGQTSEDVAFGYNKDIITGLLRNRYGFNGVVCTDWGLITDHAVKPAAAWGVEHLSDIERAVKIIDAGCDMFGGEARVELIIESVKNGTISEERLSTSIRRILRDKFRLGLFDNPYVDLGKLTIVGNSSFIEKGKEAQRKSLVLLKNEDNTLPLPPNTKIYVEGMSKEAVAKIPNVVSRREDADFIVLKINTPFEPRSEYMLERFFHQGRLDFPKDEKDKLLKLINSKPTITIVSMDRPAVIPDIDAASKAVIADFYIEEEILFELIFGSFNPSGKLPIEMPSSMEAVLNQKEDVPYDSQNPLYPFGHGLSFNPAIKDPPLLE